MENIKQIELYQLDELNDEILFISKSDMSLKYLYELNLYWKEFCFDILDQLQLRNLIMTKQENLLTFLKNNYKIIIENNKLDINIKDYVELNDYITLKEWLELDNTCIEQQGDRVFLSQKIDVDKVDF